MRVKVWGTYQGEEVVLWWEDGELDGPLQILNEIIEASTDHLGRILVLANGERVRGDLLDHPAGFAFCAAQVMTDVQSDYEIEPIPPGAIT